MKDVYFIIETANTHGGDYNYLEELVDSFSAYKEGFGIKFQAFSADRIATKDFPSYNLYQQLHFSDKQWEVIIAKAASTKDVWLDIFDIYGVEIFKKNQGKIYGIKFQSSVLNNLEIINALSEIELSSKKIILNVAAQSLESIQKIIKSIELYLNPLEILIEFGFQAYPTSLEDSGMSKIKVLRSNFSNRLVFADHVDGKSEDAIILPLMSTLCGVDVIEKHVMLEQRETKYDYFSSIGPFRFGEMVQKISKYLTLNNNDFINKREITYLKNTVMIPILKIDKAAGTLFDYENDFVFRRSGRKGLNIQEIQELQNGYHILSIDRRVGEPLFKEDFRKAKIGIIIVCRMKSSRLTKKAILPIGELASVERCIKSVLRFTEVQEVVLATSDSEEDTILENYRYRKDVGFFRGHPIDVMKRVLDAADEYKLDIISRVTADMPYVSDEIFDLLLHSHFNRGADYSLPIKCAVGTASNIITVVALKRIKTYFPNADYSEYLPYYFVNNPHLVKINYINLPDELTRDYRLTLDYQEDLTLMEHIEAYLNERKIEADINEIFSFLDANPNIGNINKHLQLKYLTDPTLIEQLNLYTRIK